MEAMKADGAGLRFVPKDLITPELCLEAVKHTKPGFNSTFYSALNYIPKELRTEEIYFEATKLGYRIDHIPAEFRSERVCFEVIKFDARAIFLEIPDGIPEEHKTYKLYLEAVKQYGSILKIAPKEFITPEMCLEAVKMNTHSNSMIIAQSGDAIIFIPDELKTPEICMIAVKLGGNLLSRVPEKLRTYEICMAAVNSKPGSGVIRDVPKNILTDEMCFIAVKHTGEIINDVPEKFLTYNLYLEAAKTEPFVIKWMPEEHKTKELCITCITSDWRVFDEKESDGDPKKNKPPYVPEDYWNDIEFCKQALYYNPYALRKVPSKFITLEMCKEAVINNIVILKYVPKKLRTEEVCMIAMENVLDYQNFKLIPEEIREKVLKATDNWDMYIQHVKK
jgi:hypothetical protein